MKLRLSTLLCAATVLTLSPLACTGSDDGGADAAGGAAGAGGSSASGGAASTGGALTTGGSKASGGATNSGGQPASGGSSGSSGGAPGCGSGGLDGLGGLGGLGGLAGDFFPETITVTTAPDASWKLSLRAFTLIAGPAGPEVYAAVQNDGGEPTCAVQLSIEFFDACGTSLGSAINTLKHPSHYWYALSEAEDVVVACLGPGEISMGVVKNFPPGLELSAATVLRYRIPSLKLDVDEPFEHVSLAELEAVTSSEGTLYRGALQNDLDVPVTGAYVTVFPTTASGRPLGMTTTLADEGIAADGTWVFETPLVEHAGDDFAVYFDYDSPL